MQSLKQSNDGIVSYIPELLTGYEKFTEQENELQQIEDSLNKSNIVVIPGHSGIGKST